jgi:asparagine synthase (glutamine-hydrolysing)
VGRAGSAEAAFFVCGIAGFEIDGVDVPAASAALIDALSARGPDARWSMVCGSVALVETRLAVIDLSDEVVYPMANETGDVRLVFNGEIYDHEILRQELETQGHRFRTHCDAEVVLHGYEEWGAGVFPRLNGMFALAILDERSGDVLLARDRLGIKPLVRTTGSRFAFASDAIALVEAGLSSGQIDLPAVQGFAAFHYVPPPATGIADVAQVAPGTAIRRRPDGTEDELVWAETPFAEAARDEVVTVEEAEQALLTAVRRQLVADVEVGVFLSGGLDSSLVLSAAVALGARPQAFSLGFAGHGDYDEAGTASRVAARLGVLHHVAQFSPSFESAVDGVAQAYDTPFADASAVATIALARLTRAHVTVALSGTGGDDLFAGYYRHRAYRLRSLVGHVPPFLLRSAARGASAQAHARRSRARLLGSYLARLADAGGRGDVDQYLALTANLTSPAGLATLRVPMDRSTTASEIAQRFGFEEPLHPTELRAIQRFELQTYLPGDLLCKEDRATMAVGLEARVPLLDDALLELAKRTPEQQMISLRQGKIILRELAKRFGTPITKLKRGFAVPLGAYFEGPWRADAREWFSSAESDLVDAASAARLLDENVPPATDLWMLATLVAWENRLKRARFSAGSEPTTSLLASPS